MSGLVGPPSKGIRRQLARGEIRTTALHAAAGLALCTTGLVLALVVRAPRTDIAVRCYAAAVAALFLSVVVRALRVASPSPAGPTFEELTSGARSADGAAPGALTVLELAVRLAPTSAADYHIRLRPVLTDLARQRLARRGVRLDAPRHRERAEALLGTDVYALVAPEVVLPDDRLAPGPRPGQLERVLSTLEGLL